MKIYRISPVMEESSPVLLARVYTTDAVVATPGSFNTLKLSVYGLSDLRNAVAAEIDLTPISGYVYSSLQTDRDWTLNFDSLGYNFAYVVPAAYLPTGGETYQFQFTGDAGSGYKTRFAFNVPTLDVFGA